MVLLRVNPGTDAGRQVLVPEFPFQIGRSEKNHLQLLDPGIWSEHCLIDLDIATREFHLRAFPNALCYVNGEPSEDRALRSGDTIQVGGCRILFSLAPARQGALRLRQAVVWSVILLAVLGQAALLVFLNRS